MTEAIDILRWAEAAAAEMTASGGGSLRPCVVSLSVSGAPDGDVGVAWEVTAAEVAVVATASEPDAVLTAKYKDFVDLATGKVPPAVAFMQGKLKPAGDMNLVLDLLAKSATPDFEDWLSRTTASA